jgi:hypothetical protein
MSKDPGQASIGAASIKPFALRTNPDKDRCAFPRRSPNDRDQQQPLAPLPLPVPSMMAAP